MKALAFTKKKVAKISPVADREIYDLDTSVNVSPKDVMSNNADVLLLENPATKALKKEKNFKHAQFLMLPFDPSSLISGVIYSLRYLIRGRLRPIGFSKVMWENGTQSRFITFKIASKKQHFSERSFYPKNWSNAEFLSWLDEKEVKYVVMRWYEDVVSDKDINDIDILIDDPDIPKIRKNLNELLGTQPVDLHALSGGETGGIDKMAYFPPAIGRHLIDNRVKDQTRPGYKLAPMDEFQSLAYHALFRKGYKSGLPTSRTDTRTATGKIYTRLSHLKETIGVNVDLDMESLLSWLKQEGWVPPNDMIAKVASSNQWIRDHLSPDQDFMAGLTGHYFAMILREITEKWGITDKLIADIEKAGFQILYKQKLSDLEKIEIAQHIRGGNWSAGPWPVSGGGPSTVLIIADINPIPLNRAQRKNHKSHQNARILFKQKWREEIDEIIGKENSANFVHTSDNNLETLDYVQHFPLNAQNVISDYEKKLLD